HGFGDMAELDRDFRLKSGCYQRLARVPTLAQKRIERDPAEQWDSELCRKALAAAGAEDLAGHVLDHSDESHPGLLRHRAGAGRHLLRSRLWSRDDDRLRARQQLAQ